MRTIYVKSDVLKEAVDYLNNEMTFFAFFSHVKSFLKELLVKPLSSDIDDYLKEHGIERGYLIRELINRHIIEKETKIESQNGEDRFSVSYKIPKRNFERKMRRLYMSWYEKNEIDESKFISEDGGATSCGSAMQGGGLNPDSGQYTTPIGSVQRRKIYITKEQSEILKEMSTTDAGDYQYDVPFKFNGGNDPSYNHSNIFAKSFQNKKKGIRKKNK